MFFVFARTVRGVWGVVHTVAQLASVFYWRRAGALENSSARSIDQLLALKSQLLVLFETPMQTKLPGGQFGACCLERERESDRRRRTACWKVTLFVAHASLVQTISPLGLRLSLVCNWQRASCLDDWEPSDQKLDVKHSRCFSVNILAPVYVVIGNQSLKKKKTISKIK